MKKLLMMLTITTIVGFSTMSCEPTSNLDEIVVANDTPVQTGDSHDKKEDHAKPGSN